MSPKKNYPDTTDDWLIFVYMQIENGIFDPNIDGGVIGIPWNDVILNGSAGEKWQSYTV